MKSSLHRLVPDLQTLVGTTPLPGVGTPLPMVPANVQTATDRAMETLPSPALPDFLESGMGDAAAFWVGVQELLAQTCRTIAYDRAGLGGSEPSPAPRTIETMIADTIALLEGLPQDDRQERDLAETAAKVAAGLKRKAR